MGKQKGMGMRKAPSRNPREAREVEPLGVCPLTLVYLSSSPIAPVSEGRDKEMDHEMVVEKIVNAMTAAQGLLEDPDIPMSNSKELQKELGMSKEPHDHLTLDQF